MKKQLPILAFALLLIGAAIVISIPYKEIRHRITPRLELVIDSGRVDTVFVYRVEATGK